jgi:hypothetical protein
MGWGIYFNGERIAEVIGDGTDDEYGIARLMATAPELLEALESLWKQVQRYNIGHEGSELLEVMSDARAAIAKAKGDAV